MCSDNVIDLEKIKLDAEKSAQDHELQVDRLRLEREGMSDVGWRVGFIWRV